ncbi:MAG: hypothetical protein F6K29_33105 [Okeania sp. SIO2G5]|nr:hypothetical protein [Okeania sp. SIO2G5]
MIEKSEVYEGKKRKISSKSKWQELWQEITDVFNTEASFSTFEAEMPSEPDTKVIGNQSNDELVGSGDRDKLIGKQGQDFLKGRGSDDLLKGGQHRDVLVGGAGSDTFVIQDKRGFDIVRDFTDGKDSLKLGGDLTFDQLEISQKGTHTLIHKGSDLLMVLRNIDTQRITAIDFQ